jgi:acetylornithine/succinyldiaminopimelate/putrescine aminotransferase
LSAGTHGTTYGGTPLACAVALKILEVVERDHLADNARDLGEHLRAGIENLIACYPTVLKSIRGLGFMLGLELVEKDKNPAFAANDKTVSIQFVNRLHDVGLLTIPSGAQVVRLLPALNLTRAQADEGIEIIARVAREFA